MAGIYLHIPFCNRKCSYCDFYSVDHHPQIPQFLIALIKEISLRRETLCLFAKQWDTVYFGGGTPSLLNPEQMKTLLHSLGFFLSEKQEITMEANPGAIASESLQEYIRSGINRISIGVQSFEDSELQCLGRMHTARQAEELVVSAQRAGFHDVGMDLIYGIPGQSLEAWQKTLRKALCLSPDHISAYALTWSHETSLGRKIFSGELPCPDEETVAEMYLSMHRLLVDAGYEHYEISNFAKPGHRCRHNEGYWTGEPYLGFGPSAHSFVGSRRFWNVSDLFTYIHVLSQNQLPLKEEEILSSDQCDLERLDLGLRRKEGIPLAMLGETQDIGYLIQAGLAVRCGESFSLTAEGFLLSDEIALQLACSRDNGKESFFRNQFRARIRQRRWECKKSPQRRAGGE